MKHVTGVRAWVLFVVLLASLAPGADTTNTPPAASLETLRPRYDTMLAEITSRFETDASQLPPKYLKAVEAAQLEAQGKGDLQGVMAAKKESAQFALSDTVPDTDEAEFPAAIKALRARYRQQVQQVTARRDKDTASLVQQYCGRLATLEKQLTRDGKIDEALAVHAETKRVKASREAQAAGLAGADPAGAAKPEAPATPVPPAPAGPAPAARGDLAALLATGPVPEFTFTDSEARQRTELLNRLGSLLSTRGIKTRVSADSLEIESVSYVQGAPRYRSRYVPYDYSRRDRSYALTEATPLTVLQASCALLGVGYRLDATNNEVVLLDRADPAVDWMAEATPAGQILKDMATTEGRKRYAGRTVVVTGTPVTTVQGLGEVSITLTDRVRLVFPRTPANVRKVGDIQAQNAQATKANRDSPYARHAVEVTALGRISSLSTSVQLALEDCVLLECYSGTTYGSTPAAGGRAIRIDDHPATRTIRRIGE